MGNRSSHFIQLRSLRLHHTSYPFMVSSLPNLQFLTLSSLAEKIPEVRFALILEGFPQLRSLRLELALCSTGQPPSSTISLSHLQAVHIRESPIVCGFLLKSMHTPSIRDLYWRSVPQDRPTQAFTLQDVSQWSAVTSLISNGIREIHSGSCIILPWSILVLDLCPATGKLDRRYLYLQVSTHDDHTWIASFGRTVLTSIRVRSLVMDLSVLHGQPLTSAFWREYLGGPDILLEELSIQGGRDTTGFIHALGLVKHSAVDLDHAGGDRDADSQPSFTMLLPLLTRLCFWSDSFTVENAHSDMIALKETLESRRQHGARLQFLEIGQCNQVSKSYLQDLVERGVILRGKWKGIELSSHLTAVQ
jgi:hypothetical protein